MNNSVNEWNDDIRRVFKIFNAFIIFLFPKKIQKKTIKLFKSKMKTLENNEGKPRDISSVFEGSRLRSHLLLTLEVVLKNPFIVSVFVE